MKNDEKFKHKRSFFYSYFGPSMYPTFQEGELLEIASYEKHPMQVGDVIVFKEPEKKQIVVHRVVQITPSGITSRGDNNTNDDRCFLQLDDIIGKVIIVWYGSSKRKVFCGARGVWQKKYLRQTHRCTILLTRLLLPFLQPFFRLRVSKFFLPKMDQYKKIFIQHGEIKRIYLLSKHRVVGSFDFAKGKWNVRFPYQLLFQESK